MDELVIGYDHGFGKDRECTVDTLREIGQELFLSTNTIKTHTRAIYRKLGATTRAEAVERAYEAGLLP